MTEDRGASRADARADVRGDPREGNRPGAERDDLRAARRHSRGLIGAVAVFSVFVNLLMLTGPLYMLQVYDRVLGSGSEETLAALTLLLVFLFGTMAVLDHARARVLGRIAVRLRAALDARVFGAILRRAAVLPETADAPHKGSLRDLDAVQRFVASPVLTALFDLPWTPFFLAAIFIFHPWMGTLAILSGVVLVCVTLANQITTRHAAQAAAAASEAADRLAEQIRTEAETIRALGMRAAVFARWEALRGRALAEGTTQADRSGAFGAATRTLRLLLQSLMLGLGALLVLRGELSAGAMIAASILLGRALAPVEQAIGQWEVAQRGVTGWRALGALLHQVPQEPRRTALPRPAARLDVEAITMAPPGARTPTLRGVSFTVEPGQAIGVIGASGAGKTTLGRGLTGLWRPAAGRIRLDRIALDQYDPDTLGRLVGYLPQRVALFDGTIAENIARFDPQAKDSEIVAVAQRAAAHQMIVDFPEGYDTRVTAAGGRLSGGQMQRIGLARALYGDPVMLVLDEPNSNLDNDGTEALNAAIRDMKARGGAVLIMAHRPASIRECDMLLVLENGMRRAFGPRDQVLRETLANAEDVRRLAPGGVA